MLFLSKKAKKDQRLKLEQFKLKKSNTIWMQNVYRRALTSNDNFLSL